MPYRGSQEIDSINDAKKKFDRLCELNVIEQVRNVLHTTVVRNALHAGKDLKVHGFIYDIQDGLLRDLCVH